MRILQAARSRRPRRHEPDRNLPRSARARRRAWRGLPRSRSRGAYRSPWTFPARSFPRSNCARGSRPVSMRPTSSNAWFALPTSSPTARRTPACARTRCAGRSGRQPPAVARPTGRSPSWRWSIPGRSRCRWNIFSAKAPGRELFGSQQQVALDTARALAREADALAVRRLDPGVLADYRKLVSDYAARERLSDLSFERAPIAPLVARSGGAPVLRNPSVSPRRRLPMLRTSWISTDGAFPTSCAGAPNSPSWNRASGPLTCPMRSSALRRSSRS